MHPSKNEKGEIKGGHPRVFTSLKRASYIRPSASEIFSPSEGLLMGKNLLLKIRL